MGRNVFGSATTDGPGSKGGVLASPALFATYRANILGTNGQMYINALIRLKGGAAAIPAFRADLARVTGRSDIDVWNNREFFGGAIERITRYEAACLLAFALAALVAALFLIGQSVARYTSATVADLQVLQAVGMTPRQAVASATAPPLLAAAAGATLGVVAAIVASRWMPIGAASYQEPHPGIGADWLILGPGWVLAPVLVAAGSAAAAALALTARRRQAVPRRSAVAAVAAAAGLGVPVVVGARFALEPGRGRAAVPVRPGPARRGGRRAGRAGRLHLLGRGVRRRRQPGALRPDLAAGHVPRPVRPGLRARRARSCGRWPPIRTSPASTTRGSAGRSPARSRWRASPTTRWAASRSRWCSPAGGCRPRRTRSCWPRDRQRHARRHRLGGLAGRRHADPEPLTVTGIGFVPAGPHNSYDEGAWLTPAGYDRLFRGAHYAFKFHLAVVALRPGADVQAVAHRLNARRRPSRAGRPSPSRPRLRRPRSRRSGTWPRCRWR